MIARWLGLPDRRGAWIFALSALVTLALLLLAMHGSKEHRVNLLFDAGLACFVGSALLGRAWRGLAKTLPEIYNEKLQSGRRMSAAEKLLSVLCIGLISLAFYVQFAT